MKKILDSFREYEYTINEEEVDRELHDKLFRVSLRLRIARKGDTDLIDVLNKIRGIPGVTITRQTKDADEYRQYYIIDVAIKFMTLGKRVTDYIKSILVPYINSDLRSRGVPNASVRYVNWASIQEIPR